MPGSAVCMCAVLLDVSIVCVSVFLGGDFDIQMYRDVYCASQMIKGAAVSIVVSL